MAGALAIRKGISGRTGMVTGLPEFSGLALADPAEMAFGGWEIRSATPLESACNFFKSSQLPSEELLPHIKGDLMALYVELDMETAEFHYLGTHHELYGS